MSEHHDEQVAAVVAVLAEHYWNDTRGDSGDEGGKWWRCRCGHEENIAGMSGWWSWRAAHDRHVAKALLALRIRPDMPHTTATDDGATT